MSPSSFEVDCFVAVGDMPIFDNVRDRPTIMRGPRLPSDTRLLAARMGNCTQLVLLMPLRWRLSRRHYFWFRSPCCIVEALIKQAHRRVSSWILYVGPIFEVAYANQFPRLWNSAIVVPDGLLRLISTGAGKCLALLKMKMLSLFQRLLKSREIVI